MRLSILFWAVNIALVTAVSVALPRLTRRISTIPLKNRILWYVGLIALVLAPCLASDLFKVKTMFVTSAYLLAVYLVVTASLLRNERILRLD